MTTTAKEVLGLMSEGLSVDPKEVKKHQAEMSKEYGYAFPPEFKDAFTPGKKCYIHFTRNADFVLKYSVGQIATVVQVWDGGLILSIPAYIINNNMLHYDEKQGKTVLDFKYLGGEQARHVFITSPKVKGKLLNAYIHDVGRSSNSGQLYIAGMSSMAVE